MREEKKKVKQKTFQNRAIKTELHFTHEMGSIYTKMFMAALFLRLTKQPGTT